MPKAMRAAAKAPPERTQGDEDKEDMQVISDDEGDIATSAMLPGSRQHLQLILQLQQRYPDHGQEADEAALTAVIEYLVERPGWAESWEALSCCPRLPEVTGLGPFRAWLESHSDIFVFNGNSVSLR